MFVKINKFLVIVLAVVSFSGCFEKAVEDAAKNAIDAQSQTFTINIRDNSFNSFNSFNPSSQSAKAADTIKWVNTGSVNHDVTFTKKPKGAGNPNSGTLTPGSIFSTTLIIPGTYEYYCKIHPTMKGTITVIQ